MKNLIHTAVVTLLAASAAHAQQAVQWKVSDGGNGHWYKLVLAADPATWQEGQAFSARQGAHLATITTHVENLFLASYIQSNITVPWGAGISPEGCWLGGRNVGGAWTWCTGEPWDFTGWNQTQCIVGGGNQPDSDGVSMLLQIACLSGGECRWDDICVNSEVSSCTRPFILLEWSADCNSDGIVDYGQCHDGTLPDYNGNNIPDCCEQGTPCAPGSYPVQWRVEDGGNGHWYELEVGVPRNWLDARGWATSIGGYLATFHSPDEWVFINSKFDGAHGYWIGLFQDPPTGLPPDQGWRWVTNEPLTFSAWCPGEPNDWIGYQQWVVQVGNTCWDDTIESGRQGTVVEWSSDCNNDGIVDYGQILQGQLGDTNADGIPDICQEPTCHDVDLYTNGRIDGADLAALLSEWGPTTPITRSDFNHDGVVNGADLSKILGFWGPCQ